MTRRLFSLHRGLLVSALSLALTATTAVAQPTAKAMKSDLRADMRKLWEDHITWTRLYIISAAANLPEKEATTQRLLKNQTDIGDAIKPFYGDDAGNKLTTLLKSHILIAAEIIDAAMKGDKTKQDDASKRWTANADEIAGFLSAANSSNWPLADMKHMMHEHLDLTTQEVVAQLGKKWDDSIAAYDKVHGQILKMADALAEGISKQFPQKVSN